MNTRWSVAGGSLLVASVALFFAVRAFIGPGGEARGAEGAGDVVLYSSTDAHLMPPILEAFQSKTGIRVKYVGDTEATKTTGLVERLLAEKERPRADVWWSNEAIGTMTLTAAGVLEPFVSRAEADVPGGWPQGLRAPDRTWYGFAQRARVISFSTNRVARPGVPLRLRDLTQERWRGRVGMARPQFGTTRSFIAALVALHGEGPVREWLSAMKANDLRIYEGNSAVVQGLHNSEIDIGLTDSDDVYNGIRNGWAVDMVYEAVDAPTAKFSGLPSQGPLVIPNTVGRVRGSPNPNEGARLAEFLLSETVERMLAESDSRNIPVRPTLAKELKMKQPDNPAPVQPADVALALPLADRLLAEMFPLK